MKPIVIIGTGLAGYNTAKEFRKLDSETPLHLITSDDGRFYSKPMLSSALTNGKTPEALASASAGQMAEQLNATIWTNAVVNGVDSTAQHIDVRGGIVPYSRLILALGAEPIPVDPGGRAATKLAVTRESRCWAVPGAYRNA